MQTFQSFFWHQILPSSLANFLVFENLLTWRRFPALIWHTDFPLVAKSRFVHSENRCAWLGRSVLELRSKGGVAVRLPHSLPLLFFFFLLFFSSPPPTFFHQSLVFINESETCVRAHEEAVKPLEKSQCRVEAIAPWSSHNDSADTYKEILWNAVN